MKVAHSAMACLALLWVSAVVAAQASDRPNRPVPKMSSDDLLPSSRPSAEPEPDAAPGPRPSAGRAADSGGGTVWHRDPREAIKLASSSNKLLIIDVFTDWCGWCKKMDHEIYTDPRIAALSRQEVFLKLNAEDRGPGQDFARQANVTGFPTTVILDGEGNVLDSKAGFISTPEAFLQFVRHARSARRAP